MASFKSHVVKHLPGAGLSNMVQLTPSQSDRFMLLQPGGEMP